MSMIHVNPKAVAGARSKAPSQDLRAPTPVGQASAHRPADQEMTHAWSIGVTNSGREWTGKPDREKVEETCPPEVYIG